VLSASRSFVSSGLFLFFISSKNILTNFFFFQ
jgi:hypothetical protein